MPNNYISSSSNPYISSHSGPAIDAAVSFVNAMPAPDSSLNGKILVVTESAYEAQDFNVHFANGAQSVTLSAMNYIYPGSGITPISTSDDMIGAFKKAQAQINNLKNRVSDLKSQTDTLDSRTSALESTISSAGFSYQAKNDLVDLLGQIILEGKYSVTAQNLLSDLTTDLSLNSGSLNHV